MIARIACLAVVSLFLATRSHAAILLDVATYQTTNGAVSLTNTDHWAGNLAWSPGVVTAGFRDAPTGMVLSVQIIRPYGGLTNAVTNTFVQIWSAVQTNQAIWNPSATYIVTTADTFRVTTTSTNAIVTIPREILR